MASPESERFSVSFAQPMYCHGEALAEDAAAEAVDVGVVDVRAVAVVLVRVPEVGLVTTELVAEVVPEMMVLVVVLVVTGPAVVVTELEVPFKIAA